MTEIIHIVGNRPQFIKLWVLYDELKKNSSIKQTIIHSGQHYSKEMNDIFFEQLQIPQPNYNLNISNSNNADNFIAHCSQQLQQIFQSTKNAIAFVYGDTNTTLAAALAAKRTNTTLHHFEAGVRTGQLFMPEEMNRVLTDRLADVNYCCTQKNYDILLAEGFTQSISAKVILTGDLMYDAFLKAQQFITKNSNAEQYIAVTIHRVENILNAQNLAQIVNALNEIHKSLPIKMPVHPHTQKRLSEFGIQPKFETITPLDYLQMQEFIANAKYVITDSGGVSREAFFAQKPSLIIMDSPFWQEIIDAGCGIQTIADTQSILNNYQTLQNLRPNFNQSIFGDGNAAKKIHFQIENLLTHNG